MEDEGEDIEMKLNINERRYEHNTKNFRKFF